MEPYHEGIRSASWSRISPAGQSGRRQIACKAWLKEPRWLLVVQQDYDEAFDDVNHANFATLVFLHLSALTILIVTVLVTRHMLTMIRRRDAEADQLNQQLMQTGKLASIGELSAGVAHEINNPLAIILTERQILLDSGQASTDELDAGFQEQFNDSMCQIDIQIQRCKRITHNLLRFSRRTQSVIETVDLNAFIQEVVDLMEREARTSGIKFVCEPGPEPAAHDLRPFPAAAGLSEPDHQRHRRPRRKALRRRFASRPWRTTTGQEVRLSSATPVRASAREHLEQDLRPLLYHQDRSARAPDWGFPSASASSSGWAANRRSRASLGKGTEFTILPAAAPRPAELSKDSLARLTQPRLRQRPATQRRISDDRI